MSTICKQYAVDLSAYFDGELDADETRFLEAHLATCTDCRESLAKMDSIRSTLRAMSNPAKKGLVLKSTIADAKKNQPESLSPKGAPIWS
ncbi:MAG: zf-HC2 domain-containing protein [Deltaproteobacteria bacterium]|nr:zf-HC2 domain-containing protein [Deltaproteobacteria bacterium]